MVCTSLNIFCEYFLSYCKFSATGIIETISALVLGHKEHYVAQPYFGRHIWTPNPLPTCLILHPHQYMLFFNKNEALNSFPLFLDAFRGIFFLATELKHLISSHVAEEGSVFFNQISTAHSVLCDFLMTAQAAVSLGEPGPTCCWLYTDTHSHTARTHHCLPDCSSAQNMSWISHCHTV